ncbi:MAG: adenosine deaminase [Bdellovibrionia bacterium]
MQTELHRHLDVSLRLSTLLRLAQERGFEAQSTSLQAFEQKQVLRKPLSNLSEVLAQFTLYQKVLDRPEVIEQVGFEAVEDCFREGTRKVEFRYSPEFVSEFSRLSFEDVLLAFRQGIQRGIQHYPEMQAGLICIASRDYGAERVDQTVDFFLRHRDEFIGLDLAGNEAQFPCRLFESSFQRAKKTGARITVHAGEASGPENVWEALELLGAERIGHGIQSFQDPLLIEELKTRKICLEMCPTSNWLTQAVPSLKAHPLPLALRAQVPVCINTDDPSIFGVSLPHEIQVAREEIGLTQAEVEECQQNASHHSFLP